MDNIKLGYSNIDNYQQDNVDNAVASMIEDIGGIEQYVPRGSKVMLKANLVRDMHPDLAGTTHPSVLTALARLIVDKCNATVTIADSSGGAYTRSYMSHVYNKCMMTEVVANATNTQLNYDFEYTKCHINGVKVHTMDIINAFSNADVVINVGKLKMHSFAGYTGAVKNLFGLIPGLVKVEAHSRYPDLDDFCQVLMDIEQYASSKVVLHVLDAVVGMEGTGPTNGTPRTIGKLMACSDPYLLDYVANMLFCDPLSQPLLQYANNRGLLHVDQLDFDLDKWRGYYIGDFDTVEIIDSKPFLNAPRWVSRLVKNNLTQKVKINKNKCRACHKCVEHCPNKAINIVANKAKITQRQCIRCYCCQELCPFDAVKLSKPMVYRVVRALSHSKNKQK